MPTISKRFALVSFALTLCISILSFFSFHKAASSKKSVMFIVHTETVGGKGVYDIYREMKKVGHDVKILAIPSFYFGKLITNISADFINKFDQRDVLYPCGKSEPYTKCEPMQESKLDYIFTQNPYDSFSNSILDPYYTHSSLRKHTKKLMFIVYGPHLFHQHTIDDRNLPNLIDVVFVDSESTKDIYRKYYDFPKDRIVVSGYESYKSVRDLRNKYKRDLQETILWLPRWTLSFKDRDLCEGGSTFLNYHYFFYNYAKSNPHINFIIRPHLLLFSVGVKGNYLSQDDLDEIFAKFSSLKNVTISMHTDRSLVDDVLASDVVISDGTSALGEVIVADKPIIYLSNGWNNEFSSNKLSRELKKYIYLAYEPDDITKYLEQIRRNKYMPFQEEICAKLSCKLAKIKCNILGKVCNREDFKKILDPIENPAKLIADYLSYDSL